MAPLFTVAKRNLTEQNERHPETDVIYIPLLCLQK